MLLAAAGAANLPAAQAGAPENAEGTAALDTVTVVATGISNMSAASAGDVSQHELASQPLLRPGAVLENVPGLLVTQHSGEGKANQYFLRAFNLDHGTDLATEIDDIPVNMPTHAHGQGYTDLNFLIPELVTDLHFKKGPYYADEGDFASAGAVRMDLANSVADSATLGYGQDRYRRGLLMGSTGVGTGREHDTVAPAASHRGGVTLRCIQIRCEGQNAEHRRQLQHRERSSRVQHGKGSCQHLQSQARRRLGPLGHDDVLHHTGRRLPQQRRPRRYPQRRKSRRPARHPAHPCQERRSTRSMCSTRGGTISNITTSRAYRMKRHQGPTSSSTQVCLELSVRISSISLSFAQSGSGTM